MKQQKFPETKIKVGATIFKVSTWADCEAEEWVESINDAKKKELRALVTRLNKLIRGK